MRTLINLLIGLVALAGVLATTVHAQDNEVPYWASLNAPEVYMRVGPSDRYRIAWVYQRQGLPVKVIRLQQGWRLIEEPDGTQGWVWNRLLTRKRFAIVVGEGLAELRSSPAGGDSTLLWNVEPGVVGALGDCENGWCSLDVSGRTGWILEDRLWGAGHP